MYHKSENRGHILTTKNVYFVTLSKCVTDFTIAFLSSRWSKKTYMERPICGPDKRVMALRKYMSGLPVLLFRTSGPRPVGAKMNYRYFRSETGTSGGWRRKAQFDAKMNYRYFWSETGTTGGACPEVPVDVYSESDSQISNRFVSRSVFGRVKLEK
jgi:hypothetical protein